ncbi:MAG: hypothetical protein ACYTHN_06280, partial [Planctomycetota bacterium]
LRGLAANRVQAAGKKMAEAAKQIEGQNAGQATGRQSEALGELHKASRMIQDLLNRETPGTKALASRQGQLSQETKKLSKDLAALAKKKPLGEKGNVGSSLKHAGEMAKKASAHQGSAAGNLIQGQNHQAGQNQEKAQKALDAAAQALAGATKKASGTGGRQDLSQAERATAKDAEEAAKKVAKAAETMKSRGAEKRGGQMGEVAKAVKSAAQSAREAGKAAQGGEASKASKAAQASKEALQQARDQLAKFLEGARPKMDAEAKAQADLGAKAKKTSKALNTVARKQSSGAAKRSAEKAAGASSQASRDMDKAAQAFDEGQPREGEVKQKKALDALKAAREEAAGLKKQLLDKSEPEKEKLAKKQMRLKEEAEKVEKKLQEMAQKAGGEGTRAAGQKAAGSMGKAGGAMKKSAETLVKRNFPKTKEKQQQALEALQEARREIKKLEDEAIRRAKERELNALVREQAGTEEKTKLTKKELEKLRRLLESRQMSQAARAMNQAKHKVSKMELIPGKEKMEEARDFLKEAEEAVKEQKRRYERLAQEQLIFQIKTHLREVLEEQKRINGLVEEMGARVDVGQRLLRGHKRRLINAAETQGQLADRMGEVEKKIEKEAQVYAWVVKSIGEDMRAIRDLLEANPPDVGPVTQGLGKEVAGRLQELLDAFKLELKRRQQKGKGG